jgi:hypothetical protein
MSYRKKSLRASMTVEASIALPLFIFFFVNIMTLFNIVKVQSELEAALHQTGSEMSLLAFDLRFGEESLGGEGGGALDSIAGAAGILYAAGHVRDYLGNGIENSCVTGGFNGMSFLQSRVLLDNDIIDLVVDYKVHPMVRLIGFQDFGVEARYYGHAWTGYDLFSGLATEEYEEEMVYVTEHGEVYHRNIDCDHLRIRVQSVDFAQIGSLRNNDRSRYRPCEYCGGNIAGGNVFITGYGERYHSSVNCPGLRRRIYTIPISEVGGRRACSSCG